MNNGRARGGGIGRGRDTGGRHTDRGASASPSPAVNRGGGFSSGSWQRERFQQGDNSGKHPNRAELDFDEHKVKKTKKRKKDRHRKQWRRSRSESSDSSDSGSRRGRKKRSQNSKRDDDRHHKSSRHKSDEQERKKKRKHKRRRRSGSSPSYSSYDSRDRRYKRRRDDEDGESDDNRDGHRERKRRKKSLRRHWSRSRSRSRSMDNGRTCGGGGGLGNDKGGWRGERSVSANPSTSVNSGRGSLGGSSSFSGDRSDGSRKPSHNRTSSNVRPGFLNVKGCHTVEDLIRLASGQGALSPNNLSAFWSRLSQLMHSKSNQGHDTRATEDLKRQLESILATTIEGIGRFDGKDVATTALGMAKIASHLRTNRKDRMVNARPPLFQQLLAKCNVEDKSNTFQILACRARSLSDFDAQAISNLAYAYALVEYLPAFDDGSTLFAHIANLARGRLDEFTPQGLSNTVWAFAKVEASHSGLFNNVADTVLDRDLRTFKPQGLSNTVWAFATAGETSHGLFKKVGDHLLGADLAAFKPQDLSNTVWAYATAGETNHGLFKKVADSIVEKGAFLSAFKPQELSNTLWAFATAGMYHPKLFDKVAGAAIAKRGDFNAQNVANTLWAFAAMGRVPPGLFDSFATSAASLISRCNAQSLANIAWAFAVADVTAPALFGKRFVNAVSDKEDEFSIGALSQLHQWCLWQQELGSPPLLPEDLQMRCRDAFISQETAPSGLQNDVVSELSAMGLRPKEEVLMPSGYSVDVTVEDSQRTIGIEVDGPYHFIARKPTGKTIIKRRQVANIDGVSIVSVPYWEWDRLGKDSVAKQEYLSNVLGLN